MLLSSLTIGYPRATVASGINATLTAGTLTVLLGRNGTGKSTLMRTMAGFLPPLSGTISIEGRNVTTISPAERSKAISIVLTEQLTADAQFSVHDLVALGRAPYTGFFGRLSKYDEQIIMQSLDSVGMTAFAPRQASSLSDGERQKVMIAKALAQQTPVILLDEPTAFLDYPSKLDTLALIARLCHDTGKAALVSTHDLDVAMRLADELWIMDKKEEAQYLASFHFAETSRVSWLVSS